MIYTVTGDGYTAVCSDRGGELISLTSENNIEYIWNGDAKYWSGQSPHLFPVVCSPLNGRVTYDGREYLMPKHGFVRGAQFRAVELAPDFVTFENSWSNETLNHFPYKYKLRITHRMIPYGFTTEYSVSGDDGMTFCLGGHPGFMCPHPGGGTFEDYQIRFHNADGAVISLTKNGYMDPSVPKVTSRLENGVLSMKYHYFDNDAMIIENLPVKKLDLVSSADGHGIRFSFEGFEALGIWTPEKKCAPFVCLEPWRGLPADVNESGDAKDKKYAVTLNTGDVFKASYTVRII